MKKIIRNLIVLEGIDGSGTTTQVKRLSARLTRLGIDHRCDAEPTSSSVGKLLRRYLKSSDTESPFFNTAMGALFSLDRSLHLYAPGGIIETAASGMKIICDRYLFSTLAYQGSSGKHSDISIMNDEFPFPEYLFFLDIDPEEALRRIESRSGTKEIYETRSCLTTVGKSYRAVIDNLPKSEMKVFILNASLPPDILEDRIASSLEFLKK